MHFNSVADIADIWRSVGEFARALGLPYHRVFGWVRRNRIPPQYWTLVMHAVAERGVYLSLERIAEIATQGHTKRAA